MSDFFNHRFLFFFLIKSLPTYLPFLIIVFWVLCFWYNHFLFPGGSLSLSLVKMLLSTFSNEFSICCPQVRDENDQAPVFSQSLYSARVTETGAYSSDRSIYVTTVTATDADVGENARLSYRILGDFQNEFYVFDNGTVVATRGEHNSLAWN